MSCIDKKIILIATAYYPPQNSAGANRMASMARSFADNEYLCFVVAPKINGVDVQTENLLEYDPIRIFRVGMAKYGVQSLLGRFINESIVAIKILRESRKHPCKYFLVTSPFLSFLIFYWLFIPANRVILDIRDLSWEYQISKKYWVIIGQRLLRIFSIIGISKAYLVTACTQAECDYLKKYRKNNSVLQINNGIELSTIDYLSRSFSDNLQKSNESVSILYAGTMGQAQGIDILCEVAQRNPRWIIKIIGDGEDRIKISNQIHGLDLKNLKLYGTMTRKEVLDLYPGATILFLRLKLGFGTAIPSKLYEYLATGRPVVYMGEHGDAAWVFLQGFKLSYCVENDDINGLEFVFEEILNNVEKFSLFNVERIRNEFTRELQSQKIQRWLSKHGVKD
jgi:glycosyltransferase involved in cell wall biosynthesis